MFKIYRSVIKAKSGAGRLLNVWAFGMMLASAGCAGYDHIPMAGRRVADQKTAAVQVILRWNHVPNAAAYNVYWSRFPGVTKHNGHKIPDAANPITITDLEPNTLYYFVVTVVSGAGESRESKEMSFAGTGATGAIDFEDLFGQPSPSTPPQGGQAEKMPPVQLKPAASPSKTFSSVKAQVTLAWDNVPGAVSYNIYWRHQPGVTKHNGNKIADVNNPHTLKDLIPGRTYYLVVTAVGKGGESRVSEEISYTAK